MTHTWGFLVCCWLSVSTIFNTALMVRLYIVDRRLDALEAVQEEN